MLFRSRSKREPSLKFHGEVIECWLPVVDWHGPLLRDIAYGQVDYLVDRFIIAHTLILADFDDETVNIDNRIDGL